jgi:hypothetical protein
MTFRKRITSIIVALTLGLVAIEGSAWLAGPAVHGFAGPAEAVVGRPLTPVSVAGVARRTVRRCAVGIYDC